MNNQDYQELEQFRELSAKLVDTIRDIRTAQDLVKQAAHLLKPDDMFLLRRDAEGHRELWCSRHPRHEPSPELIRWLEQLERNPNVRNPGTPDFHPDLGHVLVAFGNSQPGKMRKLELVLQTQSIARAPGSRIPYSNYDVLLAAALLLHFEAIHNASSELKRALEAEFYRGLYGKQVRKSVLPDERWSDFVEFAGEISAETIDLYCVNAVLHTGYQLRRSRHQTGLKKSPTDALRWIRDHESALRQVAERADMSLGAVRNVALELLLPEERRTGEPERTYDEETQGALRKCMNTSLRTPQFEDCARVVLVVLEHLGNKLRRQLLTHKSAPRADLHSMQQMLGFALDVSADLYAHLLDRWTAPDAAGDAPAEGADGRPGGTDRLFDGELGRHTLHLHFIVRLAESTTLRRRYLLDARGGAQGEPDSDADFSIPAPLQRSFMLSLTRYLLWAATLTQEAHDIQPQTDIVSASEFFDSLLYLVDRYAHVELKVDERFDIHGALLKGSAAEIQNALPARFYRDHLTHVIDVFLLGDLLLRVHYEATTVRETRSFVEHLHTACASNASSAQNANSAMKVSLVPANLSSWYQNWAIAALLHDIGYQHDALRETTVAGPASGHDPEYTQYWTLPASSTGLPGSAPRSLTGPDQGGEPTSFVETLIAHLYSELGEPLRWLKTLAEDRATRTDHGLLGGLRIAQLAAHLDSQDRDEDNFMSRNVLPAVHAIALHNLTAQPVSFADAPITGLLRICDELSEWGRQRVNMEKTLRDLHLDLLNISDIGIGGLPRHHMLRTVRANIRFQAPKEIGARLNRQLQQRRFKFELFYRNPVDGQFDPTITLLAKIYSLQSLQPLAGCPPWYFRLNFQTPAEYDGRTEYDIYALFAEKHRSLSLFHESRNEPDELTLVRGVTRLKGDPHHTDRFQIMIGGDETQPAGRWLRANPRAFFADFIRFKERLLTRVR